MDDVEEPGTSQYDGGAFSAPRVRQVILPLQPIAVWDSRGVERLHLFYHSVAARRALPLLAPGRIDDYVTIPSESTRMWCSPKVCNGVVMACRLACPRHNEVVSMATRRCATRRPPRKVVEWWWTKIQESTFCAHCGTVKRVDFKEPYVSADPPICAPRVSGVMRKVGVGPGRPAAVTVRYNYAVGGRDAMRIPLRTTRGGDLLAQVTARPGGFCGHEWRRELQNHEVESLLMVRSTRRFGP